MAVTDLTGTKWLINNLPERPSTDFSFSINFSSNNNNYTQLQLKHSAVLWNDAGIIYDDLAVYGSFGGWHQGEAYRTIEITGGTDVTNRVFIAWLTANATQIIEPTGKTIINGLNPIKKTIGTREIVKEVLNGVTVYEKQAPSVYIVSGRNDASSDKAFYSTDNGTTWIAIPTGDFTLPAMETFKLKIGGFADYLMSATSVQLGINLPLTETTQQISSNYTLTETITDVTIHGEWD